jgi:hypothetical protein
MIIVPVYFGARHIIAIVLAEVPTCHNVQEKQGYQAMLYEHRKSNVLAHVLHELADAKQLWELRQFGELRRFLLSIDSNKCIPRNVTKKVNQKPSSILGEGVPIEIMPENLHLVLSARARDNND